MAVVTVHAQWIWRCSTCGYYGSQENYPLLRRVHYNRCQGGTVWMWEFPIIEKSWVYPKVAPWPT